MFHNLISNALKFDNGTPIINISSREATGEDYKIHPELSKEKYYIVIVFADQGIGFDQKYATRMFSLFQRLQDKKGVGGTGIGLSICKKVVENHGGQIYAKGKEDEGAIFTVYLSALPPTLEENRFKAAQAIA